MMLQSALLLLIRSFGAAMLMLVKKRYFAMFMAGDVAVYLLQKVARGDFHYWFPLDGAFGLFISLLLRMIVKTITDFTGVIQFRGDAELGGLYWTANIFLALLASYVCLWVGGAGRVEWILVGDASGAFTLSFGLFLMLMKKRYRRTFFSTRTGCDWAMDFFLKADDDAGKQHIFGCNKKQWAGIRGKVKEWVLNSWWRWDEEKPEWFTESWIAKVPLDFIPKEAKEVAKACRESARRSSIAGLLVARELDPPQVHPMS